MIVQAIVTMFLPVTDKRGSRVKATAAAGSVTLYWEHGLNIERNHAAAAKALAEKFHWRGDWHGGGMPDEHSFVWVCLHPEAAEPAFQTEEESAEEQKQWA